MNDHQMADNGWSYLTAWDTGNFSFGGAYVLERKEKGLLIDPQNGGTIILERQLLDQIKEKSPCDDLKFKLIAHGIAKAEGTPEVVCSCEGPPRPSFFMLDMTSKCNFKCSYCLREIEGNNDSISWEQLDRNLDYLIDYGKQYGLTGLTIQPWGGEPMIEFEKILHIRKRFTEEGIPLCMTMETNGSLISEEAAFKLRNAGVKVGISIDGNPDTHNYYRHLQNGKDSFELARRGIENLRKAGYTSLGGIGVVTKRTLANLDQILGYLIKELKFTGFKLSIMHSPANSALCQDMLDEKEIGEYAVRLIDILSDYYRAGYTAKESSISNRMSNLVYRSGSNICVSNGCKGGRRLLSIDKYGRIYLCELMDMPDQMIGTVENGRSIPEMVEQAIAEKPYFREKKIPKCAECPWQYYCGGGCTGIVLYERGCVEGVDEISCAFNQAAYAKLAEIMLDDPELALKFI